MLADTLKEQHSAGLISRCEMRDALQALASQSKFNADYSDTLDSFERWQKEARAANAALSAL